MLARVLILEPVVALLEFHKGEKLIHLHEVERVVADFGVHEPRGFLAGEFEHSQHGVAVDMGEPFNGANADALDQQVDDLNRLVERDA